MAKVSSPLPEILSLLWRAEDDLLPWAASIISEEVYLQDHLELIVAYMDCANEVRTNSGSTDRHIALVGLFIRSFDSMSHCVRSAMTGNYTGSAMYARDLLETEFLLG